MCGTIANETAIHQKAKQGTIKLLTSVSQKVVCVKLIVICDVTMLFYFMRSLRTINFTLTLIVKSTPDLHTVLNDGQNHTIKQAVKGQKNKIN